MTRLKRWGRHFGIWALVTAATSLIAGGQERATNPGEPLVGITPTEFTEFRLGLEDFTEVETPEDGLGPASTQRAAPPATTSRRSAARAWSSRREQPIGMPQEPLTRSIHRVTR